VTFEVNFMVHPKVPAAGVSVQLSLDRFGRMYVGAGPSVGRSLAGAAGSLVLGRITRGDHESLSGEKLKTFMTGFSATFAVFAGPFLSATTASGMEGRETGIGTPQFGASGHYATNFATTRSLAWSRCK